MRATFLFEALDNSQSCRSNYKMASGASISARETLHKLDYDFDSQLQLRHRDTGETFKFINQAHYEEVADAVADYVQEVMVQDYGMKRVDLPLAEDLSDINEKLKEEEDEEVDEHVRCPIFVSSNIKEADIVLILLCGSGRVASGQWARRLCINDSLKSGSVLPFLDWAKEHSFGVVVLNPNKNVAETAEGLFRIPFNESSEAHVDYTWEAICKGLPAKHLLMVAHSYGGVSACNLLQHHGVEILERLRCIAFTDSVHSGLSVKNLSEEAECFVSEHCINWASSQEPLDTVLEMPEGKLLTDRRPGLESDQMDESARSSIKSSERKNDHADCSSINSAERKDKDGGKDGCWFSDLNDLPGLSEQATTDIRSDYGQNDLPGLSEQATMDGRGLNRRTRRKKMTDWFGARSCVCKVVSAGTDVHEETTMSAYPSICKFFLESLQSSGAIVSGRNMQEKSTNACNI